ncbi:MAG: alpha-amylase, partial [Saprospirales bacterium]|nr:alpha-amylase [Saprospirales bacterium]
MKNHVAWFLALAALANCSSPVVEETGGEDQYQPKKYVELSHPEWSKNATIYEVNIRQFTPEGNFKAFEAHLPRLKELGIDILWLMPIHPIGEKNRKGGMGSYYSVKDYYGVNPEFGTLEEFKALVNKIHDMGMYVILDWVANHSAWDNPLVEQHPEWYTKTLEGEFQPTPWYDWEDIIDFDYNQPGIRKYMTEALAYWVRETNIDGYRCDVAGFMPVDFWETARAELDRIKPVFMLAEWESRDLHKRAFDMTYSWSLWDKMHGVTTGGKPIHGLVEYMAHHVSTFPEDGYRMTFTDNHDKNSWEGNQYSNFGEGLEACMVMASLVSGMPLVYSGQEAGLDRSLAFFEKDLIEWKEHRNAEIYKKLFALKHDNQALWNGASGGEMVRIYSDKMEQIISFSREKNGDKVIALLNFSAQPVRAKLRSKHHAGVYTDWFSGER